MLTVCPGELVSLTCSHNNVATAGEQTRWAVNSGNRSRSMSCNDVVSHAFDSGSEQRCDMTPFTITMISDTTGSTLSSIIQIPVTAALDGTLIECFAGGSTLSPQVATPHLM